MSDALDAIIKRTGFPVATQIIGVGFILFGGNKGTGNWDTFVSGILILAGTVISFVGIFLSYRSIYYPKMQFKFWTGVKSILIISLAILVFIFGSSGSILAKYTSIWESRSSNKIKSPDIPEVESPPTNTPKPIPSPTLALETQAMEFVNLYFQRIESGNLDAAWGMLSTGLQINLGKAKWYNYWGGNSFSISPFESSVKQNIVWLKFDVDAIYLENLYMTNIPDANFCVEYNGSTNIWKIRDLFFEEHNCW